MEETRKCGAGEVIANVKGRERREGKRMPERESLPSSFSI
jgi:hypothetical protein